MWNFFKLWNQRKVVDLLDIRLKNYSEIIETLPISDSKKKQIETDLINFVRVIERLSNKNLILNDITNIIVIVLSAVVPILIHITGEVGEGKNTEEVSSYLVSATVLSAILAILNGIRQSYKFRDRWHTYRETAELLILEAQSYFALSGKYTYFINHELAFKKFIDSINSIRNRHISTYINILSSVDDREVQQAVSDDVNSKMAEISAAKINRIKLINSEINSFVKNDKNISYYEVDHDRQLLEIFTNVDNIDWPQKFKFKNAALLGLVYKISVAPGEAEIHGILGTSVGVKNQNMEKKGFGSVGMVCSRQDDSVVFVTCYHVVKHSSQDWDLFTPGLYDSVIDREGEFVGTIIEGEKSEELDVALVLIDESVAYDELLPDGVAPKQPIFLDESNFEDYSRVYIYSRTRNFKKIEGKLVAVNRPITLNYGTKLSPDWRNLDNVLYVHFVSTEPFSIVGDSGSLVFAIDGTAIGIVVGGDNKRVSFVIPFSIINDRYNFKF